LRDGTLELGAPAIPDGGAIALSAAGLRIAGGEPAAAAESVTRHLADLAPVPSLWWSKGSQQVAPSVLLSAALPRPEGFAALLDGRWAAWGWGEAA
jgi:type VI secretion system protein ImpM